LEDFWPPPSLAQYISMISLMLWRRTQGNASLFAFHNLCTVPPITFPNLLPYSQSSLCIFIPHLLVFSEFRVANCF
jgi:hypothetical protein